MFYPTACLEELMPDVVIKTINKNFNIFRESFFGSIVENIETEQRSEEAPGDTLPPGEKGILSQKEITQHSDGTRGVLPTNVLIHPVISYCHKYGNIMLSGLNNSMDTVLIKESKTEV